MAEPVRVLHVLGRMDFAGAETFVMNIYRNINRDKLQFDFVVHTNDTCGYDSEIKSFGGVIYHCPQYNGKNHFIYKAWWKNFYKEQPQYGIVHGHVRSTAAIYLKAAKRAGLVTIAHSHSTSNGQTFQAFVKNIMQLPIRYIADYKFGCSIVANEWLYGRRLVKEGKCKVINNAIDIDKFKYNYAVRQKVRSSLGIEENEILLGHVGRFVKVKNHTFILDVFAKVLTTVPNAKLMLVGEGELFSEMKQKARALNIESNILFMGARSDIPDLMQAMDVFIFPSIFEGLAIVLVEAQATGLTCVASDNIPKEVDVNAGLIKFLSLKDTAQHWADEAAYEKKPRSDKTEFIKKAGYDINSLSFAVGKLYLTSLNK